MQGLKFETKLVENHCSTNFEVSKKVCVSIFCNRMYKTKIEAYQERF